MKFLINESDEYSEDVINYKLSNYDLDDITDIDMIIYVNHYMFYVLQIFIKDGYKITNNYVLFTLIQNINLNYDRYNYILSLIPFPEEIIITDTDIDSILKFKKENIDDILSNIKFHQFKECDIVFPTIKLNSIKYNKKFNSIKL